MVQSLAGVDGALLRELYAKVCQAGDTTACHFLAGLHRDGVGGPPDQLAARELYVRSCGTGVDACAQVPFVPSAADFAPPFAWLEVVCEREAKGCTVLGELFEGGLWGPPQPGIAATYYERACAADSARGCFRLAGLYARGEGVEQDEETAARLNSTACDAGEDAACKPTTSPAQPTPK